MTIRLLLWIFGLSFLVWAVLDYRFRDSEGFLRGIVCLPLALGLVLVVLGWAVVGRLRGFGFWLALGILGQATSLQLIDAGPALHYQHYEPFRMLLTGINPFLVLVLAAQTAFVVAGFRKRWSKLAAWIRAQFRTWQLFGLGLIFFVGGAAVQRDPSLYVGDLLLAAFVQSINLGTIVLIVWALPEEAIVWWKQKIEMGFGVSDNSVARQVGIDMFAGLAALWIILISAVLSYVSYQWHPHITDEVVYLYQARFLANGTIALPAPPVPEAFDIYLMEIKGNQWYPTTTPGWPAILALGVKLGVPGLVNPVLAGLNILLAYLLIGELYDRRTARLAIFLLSVSPWYVFMAINFMTHTVLLTCALIAAVAVTRAHRKSEIKWGLLAGGGVGFASLIRPLDGLIVGILISLWLIGIGGKRPSMPTLVAFAFGVVLIGGLILPYNRALTGNPLSFPLNSYIDEHYGPGRMDLGFGPNRGFDWALQPFPGHSPLGATINTNLNIFSVDIELLGWSIGSLLFIALFILSGSFAKSDYLMLAVCVGNFVPYFFFFYSGGPDFGARYWFTMVVPLVVLSVRGIFFLQRRIESTVTNSPITSMRVLLEVLLLSGLALVNYFPWRAIDKYYHFWGMRPDVVMLAQEHSFGKSLVLIRGKDTHPDFASAAIYNPLDWNADAPVYAWDKNPSVEADLLRAFSDRPVWIVDAPSLTQRGYQVIEGPLSVRDLATRN